MAKQTFTTGQVLTAAQMTSLQQTAMLGGSANAQTASYVLVAADAGKCVTMSNAGATTITVNTGLFAAGDTITILNIGAGTCTVTAGTATVAKPTNATLALVTNAGGVLYFTATGAATFLPFDVGSAAATSTYVGCSVYKSTVQSINNSTYTALTWDLENYDTDSIHSTSSNTSRFTVPTGKGGKWLLSGTLQYTANATGQRGGAIYVNGVLYCYTNQLNATSALDCILSSAVVLNLSAADYVEIYGWQNSGGALDIKGNTTGSIVQFSYLGA